MKNRIFSLSKFPCITLLMISISCPPWSTNITQNTGIPLHNPTHCLISNLNQHHNTIWSQIFINKTIESRISIQNIIRSYIFPYYIVNILPDSWFHPQLLPDASSQPHAHSKRTFITNLIHSLNIIFVLFPSHNLGNPRSWSYGSSTPALTHSFSISTSCDLMWRRYISIFRPNWF